MGKKGKFALCCVFFKEQECEDGNDTLEIKSSTKEKVVLGVSLMLTGVRVGKRTEEMTERMNTWLNFLFFFLKLNREDRRKIINTELKKRE